jgi:Flp pilus assembly pilin Flp
MRAMLRRIVRDEDGLTLVEVVVVCVVGIIVVGVPLMLAVQAWRGQNEATSRGAATNRVEIGMARLMPDLRHAVHTTTITSTGATLTVPVRSAAGGAVPTTQQVVWTCTAGASCTRSVAGGTAFPLIPNLVSATFAPTSTAGATTTPQTDPAYVQVTISVRDTNENGNRSATVNRMTNPITISDGAALRNFAL